MADIGTVQGASARKFPVFTYKKPIKDCPGITWNFKDVSLKYIDLADYTIKYVSTNDGTLVQVWMQPNAYTIAKEEQLVAQILVIADLDKFNTYYLLRLVFACP